MTGADFLDFIRFNEAIDQAIAESIEFFDHQLSQARNLSLGMLGHDLRTPLGAITAVADCLLLLDFRADVTEMGFVLKRSCTAMQSLLNDLVDLNRTQLGLGISITPNLCDLGKVLADELLILRQVHPEHIIDSLCPSVVNGYWDASRLQQLLRNLVVNAVKYGLPDHPVRVKISQSESEVLLEVINDGVPIDREASLQIFEPLTRVGSDGSPCNLGLGLFIVKQIVTAHGGKVQAGSSEGTTTFSVRLPRWHNVPEAILDSHNSAV